MKYTAKIIVLLLILSFVYCTGGCNKKDVDERTLSVFDLEFSDKAVEELEAAFKKNLIEGTSFELSADTVEKLWAGAKPQRNYPRNGGYIYYGTFNDCVVWFAAGNTHAITDFELAGSRFYFTSGCTFTVCRDGKLIQLQEAYEQGFISAEDIAIVAERHAEYHAK